MNYCDTKFDNNDDLIKSSKSRFIKKIKINNRDYIIKKELTNKFLNEYNFLKKYSKKIRMDKFDKMINIAIKILNCTDSKMYIYNWIDYDYDSKSMQKIYYDKWKDFTIQLCLTVYYINHKLNIFHNDFCTGTTDLRNVMIKKNNSPFDIKVDEFNYTIKSDYIVIIDFGHQSKTQQLRTSDFYKKQDYKIKSEVFLVFYYSYKLFFNTGDIENNNYDNVYRIYESKSNSLIEFDKLLIEDLLDIQKLNI